MRCMGGGEKCASGSKWGVHRVGKNSIGDRWHELWEMEKGKGKGNMEHRSNKKGVMPIGRDNRERASTVLNTIDRRGLASEARPQGEDHGRKKECSWGEKGSTPSSKPIPGERNLVPCI